MIPKFRAWDSEANIMIYSDHRTRKLYDVYYGFEMNGKGELECRWEGDFTESQVLDGGILDNIMQSTGLKDKNGVEIFEGDIVVGQQHLTTDSSTPFEIKGLVRYSKRNTMFYLDEKSFGHDKFMHLLGSSIYQYEVIGNIYENPELLEVEG